VGRGGIGSVRGIESVGRSRSVGRKMATGGHGGVIRLRLSRACWLRALGGRYCSLDGCFQVRCRSSAASSQRHTAEYRQENQQMFHFPCLPLLRRQDYNRNPCTIQLLHILPRGLHARLDARLGRVVSFLVENLVFVRQVPGEVPVQKMLQDTAKKGIDIIRNRCYNMIRN